MPASRCATIPTLRGKPRRDRRQQPARRRSDRLVRGASLRRAFRDAALQSARGLSATCRRAARYARISRGFARDLRDLRNSAAIRWKGSRSTKPSSRMGATTLDGGARSLPPRLRREIFDATGLTVSAGVATGKMIAKIASDACKPDGLLADRARRRGRVPGAAAGWRAFGALGRKRRRG